MLSVQSHVYNSIFAFLRIGEMTHNSAKDASNLILRVHHVSELVDASEYFVALKITFGNFKHSYNQRPFTIFLHRQNSCCPVQFLLQYLERRGNRLGPLFLKVSATLKIAIFPYLRFQRFQIGMLESFLLKKK